MDAGLLDSVAFSVGILAALRSKSHKGRTVGVMMTASHNPENDNGVKLVEPLGEMLDQDWEAYAMALANAESDEQLILNIHSIVEKQGIDLTQPSIVVVGRDTR